MGRGGGQVVSVLAFFCAIQVRIPLNSTVFIVWKLLEKNYNKQKWGHLKSNNNVTTATAISATSTSVTAKVSIALNDIECSNSHNNQICIYNSSNTDPARRIIGIDWNKIW